MESIPPTAVHEDSVIAHPRDGTQTPGTAAAQAVSTRERGSTFRPLSSHLRDLAAKTSQDRLRLDELVGLFQGRTVHILIIILALPFLLPVPLPFLSTPFGVIIAMTGLCIAFRRKPSVPVRFAHQQLPAGFLPKLLGAAGHITRWLEKLSRPRWVSPASLRTFHRLTGGLIAFAGLLLLLPIPVPLTNLFPASAVLLLATAGLRRDGLCFLGGGLMLVFSLCFFGGLCLGGIEAVNWLWK